MMQPFCNSPAGLLLCAQQPRYRSTAARPAVSSSGSAARCLAANVGSVTLSANVGSYTQTCCVTDEQLLNASQKSTVDEFAQQLTVG